MGVFDTSETRFLGALWSGFQKLLRAHFLADVGGNVLVVSFMAEGEADHVVFRIREQDFSVVCAGFGDSELRKRPKLPS